MKKVIFLILVVIYSIPGFCQNTINPETTTYYLIRHAEKDRSNKENRDPGLTQEGLGRSLKWAEVFKNVKFDAVYSTNYKRTKETALPTAMKNGLEVTIYNPQNFDPSTFKDATKGVTVLIVGHSNTTPSMVNAFIKEKKYEQIDDTNNGNLYIITMTGTTIKSTLLYIN